MALPPDQLLHLGPDPAGASWNHFDLGLGLSSHINYPQAQLKNSPPQGAPWWYSRTNPTSGKDVVVFSAPLGGATTSTNTQYARCELREYERNGTTKMAFDPKSGDHWIEGKYRVFGLAGLDKPEVTMLQAHDGGDDVIMISTYQGGLRLRYNGSQVAVLDSSVSDGDEFYLKIRVNAGTPSVYYSSNPDTIPTSPAHTSSGFFSSAASGWYFKTGSYNQTNESTDPDVDPDASIIRIEMRELKHWHSQTPAGGAWPTPAPYTTTGTPSVDAGVDASFTLGGAFSRTASVVLNGATLSSQSWSILAGPTGAGSTLSTTASVSWTPSTAGIYTLGYTANTSAGNFSDQITVTVTTVSTPVDTSTAAGVHGWGKPIRADEFNYTGAPRSTDWGVYNGPGHAGNGTRDPNRVTVNGSKLVGTGLANGASFGMNHRFYQQYGKWEVRMRCFNEGGAGGIPVGSTTIFQDGFETGNFGKWSEIEGLNGTENTGSYNQNSNHQLKIVNLSVDRPHVARFELRGDDASNVGGERIEILGPGSTDVSEGDERWIEFDIMHASSWPTPTGDFVDVMQFHQPSGVGDSPPLSFNVTRQNILQTDGSGVSHTPRAIYTVQPGVWRHCIYHIKFSSSSSVGFVKCWVDGVQTVNDSRATMYPNADNYWKLGIYRDSDDDSTMVLYYDNIRMSSGPATTPGGGTSSGNTYHPVMIIWPESGRWPEDGEYDFVELSSPGQQSLGAFMHFPHDADASVQQRFFSKSGVDTSQWHNYGFEWTPNELVGYVDGVEWFRTSGGASSIRRNIQDMPSGGLTIQLDNFDGTNQTPASMEVDWARVYPLVPIPLDTDPGGGGGGGGGGTSTGAYPTFIAAGAPSKADDGSGGTVSVPAPSGMQAGYFQICVIESATSAESITQIPANWNLLDEQSITTAAGGDSGDTSRAWIYYNTTGDSVSRSWVKSGTRGFHAVRMGWKDVSALGQHFPRVSSSTLTPYATPVTPETNRAIAVAVLGSDRLNTTAGPVTVPTGWTSRYNQGQTVNGDEFEWISVADIQVADKAVAGANVPTGSGLSTSNFKLTNADSCQVFSFILEGPISTGTIYSGGVLLPAQPKININLLLTPVPVGGILLRIFPQLSARSILRGGVNLYAAGILSLTSSLFPRGALIIIPNLTFSTSQVEFAALLLQAVARLQAGALPYRQPVLRNEYEYPPEDHPFRLIAQRILDGEIIEWELPVTEDFEYTDQLSGPTVMQGSFRPEQIAVQELGLDGYAYWLHVEIGQEIRASAIMLPPQYEGSSMTFSAEGVAAVPHYFTYDSVFSQIQVDPLSVVRTLWNYVQSQPQSDYGVVVSGNSSPVRIGEPATTETTTTVEDDGSTTVTTRQIEAKPYELNWWDAKNVGEEIDSLSGQVPFDYVERHKWNSDRSDVLHYVDLGYPRLGTARSNLLFNEENILEIVPIQEAEDTYASAVLVIGAGDGADTIRAYRSESFGDRVRKQVVITDKSITNQQTANSRAEQELALRRGRMFEIGELVVAAYHSNAPIGSYNVGDDIQVQVEVSWLTIMHTAWYRITSIQNRPSSDKVRLGLARSDTLLDTSEIWVQPDDYVPFQPPPPVGSVGWNGNVFMLITPTLVVIPGVPVPTARAIMVATVTFSANGLVYGGSFAFANNLIALHSLSINGPQGLLVALIDLNTVPVFSADGLATPIGFANVSMISGTTLTIGTLSQEITSLQLTSTTTLTANGSVFTSVGVSATLTASATLSAGGRLTAQGAVSLTVDKTLSANGTVSSGTTITQLGKTSNGASTSSSSANKTVVSKVTAGVNGAVTAGHARLWVDTGSASSVRMVVYADSSGLPGSLLGSSDAKTLSSTTEQVEDFVFTGAQQASVTVGTDYWIGFTWPDPGTNNISWSRDGTAGQAQQNSLNNAASFGTPGAALSGPIDAYVDVVSQTGGGTEPVVRSASSAAEGNAPTVACPKPSGLTVGDLMLAYVTSDADGSLGAMTAPSGFTEIWAGPAPNAVLPACKLWRKVATSADVAASTFSFPDNTGANCSVIMVAIQNGTYNATTPVSGIESNSDSTGANQNMIAPSISGTAGALLLTAHMGDTGGVVRTFSSGPSGMTLVLQSVAGGSTYTRSAVYQQILTNSGETGTKTAVLSSSPDGYVAVALQVNPA